MKFLLSLLVIISASAVSANNNLDFACENKIQLEIDKAGAKLKGMKLGTYLALGAGTGGVAGFASGIRANDRYQEGYNAGFVSGSTGQSGGSSYDDGFMQAHGQTSSPTFSNQNALRNTAIGVSSGAAVGGSVFLIKKLSLKKKIEELSAIHAAFFFSEMSDWTSLSAEPGIVRASEILLPKSQRDNLEKLREIITSYDENNCQLYSVFDIARLKKFVKKELRK